MVVKEIYYGGNGITAVEFRRDRGGTFTYYLNESQGLDLWNSNNEEVYEELHNSKMKFTVSPLHEEMEIKLALDREPLRGKSSSEIRKKDMYSKLKHVNLVVYEQPYYSDTIACWMLIELPEPVGEIRYVPVLVSRTKKLGVSVHPDYHKIFLRAFSEKERHTILGFIYLYGSQIASSSYMAYTFKKPLKRFDQADHQMDSDYYKEERAPKRIPTFDVSEVKGVTYDFLFDTYAEWRNAFGPNFDDTPRNSYLAI